MGNRGASVGGHRLRLGEALKHLEGEFRKRSGGQSKVRERKRSGRFYEMGFGARSAAGSMTALSPGPNVREHGFQMHHYRGCAGDPLSRGFELLSFAYFSLQQAKKSRCRPAQGQR